MKNIVKSLLITALFSISTLSLAAPDKPVDEYKVLRATIAKTFPGFDINGLKIAGYKDSGVPGISEFTLGAQVLYVTNDHNYLFHGNIYDLKTQVNFTERSERISRVASLEKLGEKNMLMFKPEQRKGYITVFTDIDCYYCRKLHEEVEQYMAKGIAIRYIFRPLKGEKSLEKSVGVWCSKDPQEAMTNAKNGRRIQTARCENPLGKHLKIGDEFGIRGTPAIILENGQMIPGYRPVNDIEKLLNAG